MSAAVSRIASNAEEADRNAEHSNAASRDLARLEARLQGMVEPFPL